MAAQWLCIRIPQLALEVFTRSGSEEQPLAVGDDARPASILFCNAPARRRGVCSGMPVAAARALAHDLNVCSRNLQAEADALHSLAAWAYQFSSQVSLYPPFALLLEVRRSLTLFGGYTALAAGGAQLNTVDYRAWCEAHPEQDPLQSCVAILPKEGDMAALPSTKGYC